MELDRVPSTPLEEPVTTRALPLTEALNREKWRIKERVKAPSLLQCIFGQKYCARSVYYFTTGRKLDEKKIRDVGDEPSPFWYPRDTDQFCYKVLETSWRQQIRNKEKDLKYFERPNYLVRQKQDLLERLYIPEEKVDKIAHPAMLDIDPDFFRIIEARPERLEKFDVRKYIDDVRQCLKTKLQTGYYEDETFKIDEKFEEEQKKIDQIKDNHMIYVRSFEEFLAKDHQDAMAVLKKADRVARTTMVLEEEYNAMVQEFNSLSSRIFVLHDEWRDVKLCQRFVYLIGPINWRMEYDYINRSNGELELLGEGSISFLWVYKASMTDIGCTLEDLIEKFNYDMENSDDPQIHWLSPSEVLEKMETLEERCFQANFYRIKYGDPLEEAQQRLEVAERKFQKVLDGTINRLEGIKNTILADLQRLEYFEESCQNLIDRYTARTVANGEAQNVYTWVENVYEVTIAKNEQNIGMLEMMDAISERFYSLLEKYTDLPTVIVWDIKTLVFTNREKAVVGAVDYYNKLQLRQRLLEQFHNAVEAPRSKQATEFTRSVVEVPKPRTTIKKRIITKDDFFFLENFTDFVPGVHNPETWLDKETDLREIMDGMLIIPERIEEELPRIPLVTTREQEKIQGKKKTKKKQQQSKKKKKKKT